MTSAAARRTAESDRIVGPALSIGAGANARAHVAGARSVAAGTAGTAAAGGEPDGRRHVRRGLLLAVGAAGALGALARYAVAEALPSPAGRLPWATLWTNLSGSLAIGALLVLFAERFPRASLTRPVLATGFIGAFTTFSTLTVGVDLLVRDGNPALAALYAILSLLGGLLAVSIGAAAARLVVRRGPRRTEEAG